MLQHLPNDRRVVLVVIGFSFGCLLEGISGFGTPVAITSALLIALGFPGFKEAPELPRPQQRILATPHGYVPTAEGIDVDVLAFKVASGLPAALADGNTPWQGFSGAGVVTLPGPA